MSSRIYVGRLSDRATERDVEHFFRGYGRIREIILKGGFGFVEFDSSRDADDAIYDLNGKDLMGERVMLEMSRRGPRTRDDWGGGRGGGPMSNRYGPPTQTKHRIIVENLSTRISWQDLKDMMRDAGEVTFADAHKERRNEGVVCFASRSDLKRAIDKFDGKDVNGKKIKIVDDSTGGRDSRSRSRSRSRRRSRSRSRSRSRDRRSRSRSRSRSRGARKSRSRSRSKDRRSRSRSASKDRRSASKDRKSRSRSGSRKASASPKAERKSRSPSANGHASSPKAGSRSRSASPMADD